MYLSCIRYLLWSRFMCWDFSLLSSKLHLSTELYTPGPVGHWLRNSRWKHTPNHSPQQTPVPGPHWWLQGRIVSCFLHLFFVVVLSGYVYLLFPHFHSIQFKKKKFINSSSCELGNFVLHLMTDFAFSSNELESHHILCYLYAIVILTRIVLLVDNVRLIQGFYWHWSCMNATVDSRV